MGLTAIVVGVLISAASVAAPQPAGLRAPGDRGAQSDAIPTGEAPEPFVPKQLPGEAEADRREALQLFAAGRLKEQKEQLGEALRFYQRAHRRDPQSVAVLKHIIPLAFNLGRSEEAFRYALRLGRADPNDPALLRQLGVHLAGEGDLAGSLAFYEQALALERERDPRAPSVVLLQSQMGKLYLIDDRPEPAAEAYAQVIEALAQPEDGRFDRRTRRMILDDAAKTLALLVGDVKDRGDEAAAYELFGRVLLEAGRVDEAQAALERSTKARPDAALSAWHRAQLASARGNHAEAIDALNGYFSARSSNRGVEPYRLLERSLTELGRGEELIERLEQLLADDADNEPLRLYLADQYRRKEQFDKARPLYEALAQSRPSLEVYRAQVELYRRQEDVAALLNTLAAALAQLRMVDLLGSEGKAVLADEALLDNLFEAARKRLTDAKDLSPDERAAIGVLALAAKRPQTAAEFFESAAADNPAQSREYLRRWGLGLLVQEQAAQAAEVLARAPQGETPAAKAERLYHQAAALELSGQTDKALAAAVEAAELAEAHAQALGATYYDILGRRPWVLFHAKRHDEARAAYLNLLERLESRRDDADARAAARDARMMLSNLAAIAGAMDEAEEWLELVLDEEPDDVSASNDLGYLWVDQGKHLNRSLKMIQHAVAAAPENAAYRDSLGWAWYRLGAYDEAVAELTKATELIDEPDGVILDHLGDALAKAGRADQARSAWERALASFEKEQDDDKARATRAKLQQSMSPSPPD